MIVLAQTTNSSLAKMLSKANRAMIYLPPKGILLYCLKQALCRNDEVKANSFTDFSHIALPSDRPTLAGLPIEGLDSNDHQDIDWDNQDIRWQNIPLNIKQNAASVLYISALPQWLSSQHYLASSLSLAEVSHEICNQLKQIKFYPLSCEPDHNYFDLYFISQLWAEFKIETQRPGWINFHLSNTGIACWLQQAQKYLSKLSSLTTPFRSSPIRLGKSCI
ncbi:MAG: hypothetical protein HC800_16890 [Phormidesmis sp. RL_2_1]|nr:hypothetical protein [Phormidesmis sp. RL_2_1]